MSCKVTEYAKDFYLLYDGRVRQFLFVGESDALLVDTGFEDSGVAGAVREITDKPVTVILTHGDRDHTGGLPAFGECRVHEKDAHMVGPEIKTQLLAEGDVFSVGDYRLEVISIPGHTYGSIALIEREKGWLFPGDSVSQVGPIYMFGKERNLELYLESLRRLSAGKGGLKTVFPCHGDCPLGVEYIDYCLEDALAYQAGKLEGVPHEFMPCKIYSGKRIKFLFE